MPRADNEPRLVAPNVALTRKLNTRASIQRSRVRALFGVSNLVLGGLLGQNDGGAQGCSRPVLQCPGGAASQATIEEGDAIRKMQDYHCTAGAHLRERAQSLAVIERFSPEMRIYPWTYRYEASGFSATGSQSRAIRDQNT